MPPNGSTNMKQRGADPPGRSKQVNGSDQGADGASSKTLENEALAERRSRSRGRSLGRSSSSRTLHRTTSSRSLAKSRSSRSLAASKKSNHERAKSLGRNERGRSKSRGKTKGTAEEGRSKSRRRSERDSAVEKVRSKSRGKSEQKRVDRSKVSSRQDGNGDHLSEDIPMGKSASSSKSTHSQPTSALENTPRTQSGLHRRASPSIEKLDAPLVPPRRNILPLSTTKEIPNQLPSEAENQPVISGISASHRGVGRSVSAQVESNTNARSPKRYKSTDEIKVSTRRNITNAPPSSFKEDAISIVPTNTLPRRPPSGKSDTPERVTPLKEFESTEEGPIQPNKGNNTNAPNDKKVLNHGENSQISSSDTSTNTVKVRPARSNSDIQSRAATKISMQPMMASASLFITILEGRTLVPIQRNILGIKKYSHPFVETYVESKVLGRTANAHRTVNPFWKSGNSFSSHYDGATAKEKASRNEEIELRVYHCGKGGVAVFMGAARIPLLTHGRPEWYPVQQRSILDNRLFCANASGELKVQVNFTAQSYPDLKPGHELPIPPNSEISLNLTWSGSPSLETSCVALDRKNGHVLWKECVYFANRINLSNSVARPELQGQSEAMMQDSLVFDLGMVPETVAAFYVVLAMRDKSTTLSDVQSFQATCRNELTHEGIGRLTTHFPRKDSSVVLLRVARSTRGNTSIWKLATIVKGYKVFREFGSLLPQLQELSSDILPFIGTPAERTALMRCGDSLQLLDYVSSPVPSRLVIGFFWKVKNKEPLKVAISLLDEELQEIDAIHRTQPGSIDKGVLYSGGSDEFEKFEIIISQIALDVHYVCFVLGPYSRQKVDTIQNVACHVVNPTKGTELARCTISNFETAPTKSVGLGCFYRTGKEWNFTILGLPSSDTTFAGRLNEIRTHILKNPLEPAISLPHPRLLKSVMPSPIPLPPPRKLALSETVEMHNSSFGQQVCTSTFLTVRSQLQK